jgi:hypothetical protein
MNAQALFDFLAAQPVLWLVVFVAVVVAVASVARWS